MPSLFSVSSLVLCFECNIFDAILYVHVLQCNDNSATHIFVTTTQSNIEHRKTPKTSEIP